MSRRTPTLVPVPRERARAIVATTEPTIVWIGDDPASAPPSAIACTPDVLATWLSAGVPAWLAARRMDGVLVQYEPSASAKTRQAARALRDRLAPRTAAALVELAELAEEPELAGVLARMPAHHVPTFADLARGLARSDDPATRRAARLLWALEHL
jgi:hypothetical protein